MKAVTSEIGAVCPPPVADQWLTRLAKLFPLASSARMPVSVAPIGPRIKALGENTIIELKTSEVVVFGTKLPLQLNDIVRLRNLDGTFKVSAVVIALCPHDQGIGIAARIVGEVHN